MEEKNILEVYNQDKKIEKIEVLKYFKLKQNNKDYIIYKPLVKKKNKDSLIFSAEVCETNNDIFLNFVNDKEIEILLNDIAEKLFKGDKV